MADLDRLYDALESFPGDFEAQWREVWLPSLAKHQVTQERGLEALRRACETNERSGRPTLAQFLRAYHAERGPDDSKVCPVCRGQWPAVWLRVVSGARPEVVSSVPLPGDRAYEAWVIGPTEDHPRAQWVSLVCQCPACRHPTAAASADALAGQVPREYWRFSHPGLGSREPTDVERSVARLLEDEFDRVARGERAHVPVGRPGFPATALEWVDKTERTD